MIHSRNHKNGFTLIEVLLSMMITACVLSPLFLMQEAIMKRVDISSHAFDIIVLAKNLLFEARQKQEPDAQTFSLEKSEIDFDAQLAYSLSKEVNQKSSLKSLQGLHQETVTVSWKDNGQKKQEQLVTFVYKKPEQKKQ